MNIIKKIIDKIKWTKTFKAKKGQPTCNSCQHYKSCSRNDVKGEYFACGAKHDGAKICKYFDKQEGKQ